MPVYDPRDVKTAVSLVSSCLLDVDETPGVLVVEFESSRLPKVVAALSRLAAEVLRHYSVLVERPYEELLQVYALRGVSVSSSPPAESMHPEVLRSIRESSMLLTASSDEELLSSLLGSVSPLVVPALSELTAKILSEIQEVDFSAPVDVLDRCSAAVLP